MGLRFPFFLVEAKGLSLAGSLVVAENQAAVSGACMLVIQRDLCASSPDTSQDAPPLCFSIVTSGPVHELCVDCRDDAGIHTSCFCIGRTTLEDDALEFVYLVVKFLDWGAGRYKQAIVKKLDCI
jgi:hypothetical protein